MRTTTDKRVDLSRMRRPPTHPGEMLRLEFLEPMGLSQAAAARRMGMSANRLNEIVREKRGVSASTAIALAELLGTSAELWLSMQSAWDLWHAYQARRSAA